MNGSFLILAQMPAGLRNAPAIIAACRAGAVGLVNGELESDSDLVAAEIIQVAKHTDSPFGVSLDTVDDRIEACLRAFAGDRLRVLVVDPRVLASHGSLLADLRRRGVRVLARLTSAHGSKQVPEDAVDGLVLKGHEAGGFVGEDSSFVLLQKWRGKTELPLYVHGGLTPQVAAACSALGIAGGIVDSQLLLLDDVHAPVSFRATFGKLAGSETVAVGNGEHGEYFRVLVRPGHEAARAFAARDGLRFDELRSAIGNKIDWSNLRAGLLPIGQDICFAPTWAEQFRTMAVLFRAMEHAIEQSLDVAVESKAIAVGAPLARALKIRLPIVQGPMTRVSDKAEFAQVVAEGGALPMLALALLKGPSLRKVLADTKRTLGDRPWGIGLLGFAPQALIDEQLAAALEVGPSYAIIAGGRPDQAVHLEKAGIPSFLHVPASGLIGPFIRGGSRRFIFEGRECGGHVGPLSSFVLWSTMVATLGDELDKNTDVRAQDLSVLFAGGIHDAVSSAMVQVLAAPLVARGVNVGILMGSAYLFTKQIVASGAIVPRFQQEVIACERTVTLASGPGHASRCAYTPFAEEFFRTRERLEAQGVPADEERQVLDSLILGRLRIASKGVERNDTGLSDIDEARQHAEGMYMLGQVATLRDEITDVASLHAEVSDGANALLEQSLRDREDARAEASATRPTDIAIIGIGSLFPKADNTEQYWENILGNVDAITEIPSHRWDWRLYFDSNRQTKDKIYSKWGGFLDDLAFDPMKYGIPPRSVSSVDPMQLIALEVAHRTLVDAGYADRKVDHEKTSVVIGTSGGVGDVGAQYCVRSELPRYTGNLPESIASQLPVWTEDSFPGILANVTAGRIANRLNFGGVNFTTDAACASSLAAVYQGVNELIGRRSDLVLAGAVDTVQGPFTYLCFSKTQALSPRGRCASFGAGSDGIVISEGVAMIALKRLADAQRDGDRIYAVIKGVGGSSDGNARGLTAPVPAGQLRAMRRAYASAGFGPETVGLFEAHGTGTVAGDIAELKSTSQLIRESGGRPLQSVIGSVKTSIGHTKSTAGLAGLVKVALALHRKVLPPHLGVEEPNPVLQRRSCPLHLLAEPRPWLSTSSQPRRAAVSAFGFGGTNFHVVLEEDTAEYRPWLRPATLTTWPAELLLWSGADTNAIVAELERLRAAMTPEKDVVMRDLAASLAARFVPGVETLAIVARDRGELETAIAGALANLRGESPKLPRGVYRGTGKDPGTRGKIAVLFSGQGSQYPEMLRELMLHFPACADTVAKADAALATSFEERFGEGNTLAQFVFPRAAYGAEAKDAAAAALTSTDVAQPALGAVDAAAYHLLRTLGLRPDLFAGHSFGEFVALYAGGAIDFASMLSLAAARGRAIVDASKASGVELGTMAAVLAPRAQVEAGIAGIDGVVIANHNAPEQLVISGSREAVAAAARKLGEQGLRVTEFPVAAGFHSPQVRPAQEALATAIEATAWQPTTTPVYSNTTAEPHASDVETMKRVMADHLVRPVEFVAQCEAMYRDGARVFIEVGPKAVLGGLVDRILGDRPHTAVSIDRTPGLAGLLGVLGQLVCAGVELDLAAFFVNRATASADPYAFRDKAPIGKHAWMVNGSGARPAGTPAKPVGITVEQLAALETVAVPATSPVPATAIPAPVNGTAAHAAPAFAAPVAAKVVPVAAQTPSTPTFPPAKPVAPVAAGAYSPTIGPSRPVAGTPSPKTAATTHGRPSTNVISEPNGMPTRTPSAAIAAAAPKAPSALQPPKVPTMTDHDQSVLNGYFNMMRTFLETQERVMSMYMRSSAGVQPERSRMPVERVLAPAYEPAPIALPARAVVPSNGHAPQVVVAPAPSTGAYVPSNGVHAPSNGVPTNGVHAPPPVVAQPPPPPQQQAAPAPAPSNGKPATLDRTALTDLLLGVVEEKTGYPRDMVSLNQNLESDLGIDSIKRVEVATAMLEYLPDAHRKALTAKLGQLNTQRTLEGMLAILDSASTEKAETTSPFDVAEAGSVADVGHPPRFVMVARAQPLPRAAVRRIRTGRFVLTDDALGVADALAQRLVEAGCTVARVPLSIADDETALLAFIVAQAGEPIAGIVHLAPLGAAPLPANASVADWKRELHIREKSFFVLLRGLTPHLVDDGHLLAASGLGGSFGRSPAPAREGLLLQGGAVGLVKSHSEERPTLRAKAVDLDPTQSADALAASLFDELAIVGGRQEIGYPQGRRTAFHSEAIDVVTTNERFADVKAGRVILATGGGRGVTAEVLREVAAAGHTLVLTGRRPLGDAEPEATASATTAGELRDRLVAQVRSGAVKMTLADVGRHVQATLAERELRANIADFRQRGATVEYHAVDTCDEASLRTMIADVQSRHGAITGVLHGAGIIEDKLVADKTSDSWSRVVDTKVLGVLLLQKLVRFESLEFFAVMSSVAGRYGNSGQGDYATANELMNRLCAQLRDRAPNVNVMALCWGPWGPTAFGQGMVNAATEAKFAEKGVYLVTAAMGRRLFADELRRTDRTDVDIVCGQGPWESHEAEVGAIELRTDAIVRGPLLGNADVEVLPKGERIVTVHLDPKHTYLASHRLDGVPILPAAAAVELFAEVGTALWPGWKVVEIKDCRVLKGIDVASPERALQLEVSLPAYGSSEGFEVSASIRSAGENGQPPRIHYRCTLGLAQQLPESFHHGVRLPVERPLSVAQAYGDWLFHGPCFQVIEHLDGLATAGSIANVRATTPSEWVQGASAADRWLFDPALLDAGPQMAILWARAFTDQTVLPMCFGRVVRYVDALPTELRMVFECLPAANPHQVRANVYYVDTDNRVVMFVEDLQGIASNALNRLAGRHKAETNLGLEAL